MRRALLLGLTALALAAVGVASMADPALAAEPLAFPVCLDPGRQEQADISGGEVVWTDYRNWGASNRDIYLFDLSTGRERTICTAQWSQCYPAISGDIIVWQDSRTSTSWDTAYWDIYAFNLATSKETAICTDAGNQLWPDVSGNTVIWLDAEDDIHVYDIATGARRELPLTSSSKGWLSVSGDTVAWLDFRQYPAKETGDLYITSLSQGGEKLISTTVASEVSISGDHMVWDDSRNEATTGRDIYLYDIAAGQERPLVTRSGDQGSAAVDGDRVVFYDGLDPDGGIYLYDIASGQERPICTAAGDQDLPAIDGDFVLWQEYTTDYDLWACDLSTPPADATPPQTTVSGVLKGAWYNHALTVKLTATDTGGSLPAAIRYSLNGTETRVAGGYAEVAVEVDLSGHTKDGPVELGYAASDRLWNTEPWTLFSFGIDTVKPSTAAPSAASAARGKSATLRYKVSDALPNGGSATVTIKIKNSAGKLVKTLGPYKGKPVNTALSAKFTVPRTWKPGLYKFLVSAKDKAANLQSKVGSNRLTVR